MHPSARTYVQLNIAADDVAQTGVEGDGRGAARYLWRLCANIDKRVDTLGRGVGECECAEGGAKYAILAVVHPSNTDVRIER